MNANYFTEAAWYKTLVGATENRTNNPGNLSAQRQEPFQDVVAGVKAGLLQFTYELWG